MQADVTQVKTNDSKCRQMSPIYENRYTRIDIRESYICSEL
nr:MAG TPA: hypothetical protein [Caudoviricetes sp.]